MGNVGKLVFARFSFGLRFTAVLAVASLSLSATPTEQSAAPDFERDIAPLLIKRCVECHQERDPSGGLVLTTKAGIAAGGGDGPALVPGAPEESYLLDRILAGEMPPEEKGVSRKLPEEEIALIRRWIASGAAFPEDRTLDLYEMTTEIRGGRDWWSFQPLERSEAPEVAHAALVENPIDAFILAKLEAAGMAPAPEADRRSLIRRAYYDVIGLPPTFEEVEAFATDERPDAWERVVDELLASPQFGEKWARHWLDVVRFAETSGYERDQEKPYAWRYRDWVVNALNDDMPYDQFVLQQLAGDEITEPTEKSVIATGMLRLGTWNDEPNEPQDYKYERLEDMVHVTSSAFLGLTVKCARCHDHKFDPIPQTDYYAMAAVFWPGAIEPRDSKLLGGPSPGELGYDSVLGWTDLTKTPPPIHLLKNGERDKPQQAVDAGAPTAIPALAAAFDPPAAEADTTMRRLQLAEWIVDPSNPLTPRVLVNRLWQHHFGEGLVRTPDNFGYKGDLPTHPALLDWLADELIRNDWRMKPLHRLMLLSRTYRQASVHPDFQAYSDRDSSNRLWWRAERRRLDAEALRDSMLYVSGELDETRGGPSFRPTVDANALEGLSMKGAAWQASPERQQMRRSLYIYSKRGLLLPMMTTFNFCDTVAPCGQRDSTITPTQALALLNNAFAHDRSRGLALRVLEEAGDNNGEHVRLAWTYALGRAPVEREVALSLAHLQEQRERFASADAATAEHRALASLCHVLLNSNEFIYVG